MNIPAALWRTSEASTGAELTSEQSDRSALGVTILAMFGEAHKITDIHLQSVYDLGTKASIDWSKYEFLIVLFKKDSYNIQWKQALPNDVFYTKRPDYFPVSEAEKYVLKFLCVFDRIQWLVKQADPDTMYYSSNYENMMEMILCLLPYIVPKHLYTEDRAACMKLFHKNYEARELYLMQCRQTGKTLSIALVQAAFMACAIVPNEKVLLLILAHTEKLECSNLSEIVHNYRMFMEDYCNAKDKFEGGGSKNLTKFRAFFQPTRTKVKFIHFITGGVRIAKAHDARGEHPHVTWIDEFFFVPAIKLAAIKGLKNVVGRKFFYSTTPNDNAPMDVLRHFEINKKKNNDGHFNVRVLDKGLICSRCRNTTSPESCMHALNFTPPWQSRLNSISEVVNAADRQMEMREVFGVSLGSSLTCISPSVIQHLRTYNHIETDLIQSQCSNSLMYISVDPPLDHDSYFGITVFLISNDSAAIVIVGMCLYKFNINCDMKYVCDQLETFVKELRKHPLATQINARAQNVRPRTFAPIVEAQGGDLLCDQLLVPLMSSKPSRNIFSQPWTAHKGIKRGKGFTTNTTHKQAMFGCMRNMLLPQNIKLFVAKDAIPVFPETNIRTEFDYLINVISCMRKIEGKIALDNEYRSDSFMSTGMGIYIAKTRIQHINPALTTKVPTNLYALQQAAFTPNPYTNDDIEHTVVRQKRLQIEDTLKSRFNFLESYTHVHPSKRRAWNR